MNAARRCVGLHHCVVADLIVLHRGRKQWRLHIDKKLPAYNDIALLVGRILIAALFLIAAYCKFKGLGGTTGYFTKLGVPAPSIMAPVVAVFELAVGILVLVGFQTRLVALAIAAFCMVCGAARAHEFRRRQPAQPLPEEPRDRRRLSRAVRQRAGRLLGRREAALKPLWFRPGPTPYVRRPQEGRTMTHVRRTALAFCCSRRGARAAVRRARAADDPDLIFRKSTVFHWVSPNDKLATYAIDDPVVDGVACHFTVPEKGGFKGWIGVAEEVSDISLACRQVGPIKFKAKFEQGDDVFRRRRSLLFKKMQIVRGCDVKRNVLVYMVYSDRIIEGSPKNSTSTVPIMPWGTSDVPKCAEWVEN